MEVCATEVESKLDRNESKYRERERRRTRESVLWPTASVCVTLWIKKVLPQRWPQFPEKKGNV